MAPEKRKRSDRMSAKTRKVYLLYQYYLWDRTEKRKRTPENGRHQQKKKTPRTILDLLSLCVRTHENAAYRKKQPNGVQAANFRENVIEF